MSDVDMRHLAEKVARRTVIKALDAYRDFIRLRAVAEAGCYRLQWSGDTCLEAGKWIMSSACPSCTAQREIEALIGGAAELLREKQA